MKNIDPYRPMRPHVKIIICGDGVPASMISRILCSSFIHQSSVWSTWAKDSVFGDIFLMQIFDRSNQGGGHARNGTTFGNNDEEGMGEGEDNR
jgi:hypothetical protein